MIKVDLLDYTKLSNAVIGARTCWNSFHKGGNYEEPTDEITDEDKNLLDRLVHKNKHESIIEHITYVFSIKELPRYALQELVRHRIASYSVKSTRYTLKELRNEERLLKEAKIDDGNTKGIKTSFNWNIIDKYLDLYSEDSEDKAIIRVNQAYQLDLLWQILRITKSNDLSKVVLPESFKCDLVFTINARSLRNFLNLRTSNSAHFKIRELAYDIFFAIPKSHKFLYEDCLHTEKVEKE